MPGTKERDRLPPPDDDDDDRNRGRDEPEDERLPPPRTRVGEILVQSRETGKFIASLSSNQFLTLVTGVTIGSMIVIFMFILYRWDERGQQDKASIFRYAESQSEVTRQASKQEMIDMRTHCKNEATELRAYFADQDRRRDERFAAQDERRMKAELERDAANRAVLVSITLELAKLREAIKPFLGKGLDECPVPAPNP